MSQIQYEDGARVSLERYQRLLELSTLGERRPMDDPECLRGALENSNLMVSAWDGDKLIGLARSLTDFHLACYLADLAVDQNYQRLGIGRRLQELTREQLGPRCTLILISAPPAMDYYKGLGYDFNDRCWVLEQDQPMSLPSQPQPNAGHE